MALKDNKRTASAADAKSKAMRLKGSGRGPDAVYTGTPLSMTGIRSGLLYSNLMKIVLLVLIAIFAIGFGLQSIGTGFGGAGSNGAAGGATGGPDPVARVAGQDISRQSLQSNFLRQLGFMEQFGQPTGVAELLSTKQRALQTLTDQAAQYKAAQDAGITVSDADIDQKITSEINDAIKQDQGANEAGFRRQIESTYGSLAAYQENMRKNVDREAVRKQLMIEKLEKQIKDQNKVSEADYKQSVTKLDLLQIVIQPKLPAPGEKDQKAAQEKNAADAKARADKVMAELKANSTPGNFAPIAKKESDDIATKAKGGDVGWKLPTELYYSPTIKDAIAKSNTSLIGPLQDDMSKYYYIFYIKGRKLELPKDYSKPKKKEEYIKNFKTQKDNEVWTKYQDDLKKKNEVEVDDPALSAYQLQSEKIFTAPADQQN
ncbi:MAG: SurA N-terminal domain-containing protein, partial [Abitibacteriaceae bacterium]|nr:SurA N-terminal domain-containing protein [Abditibacteriaceae bacterium]